VRHSRGLCSDLGLSLTMVPLFVYLISCDSLFKVVKFTGDEQDGGGIQRDPDNVGQAVM
jgi:hypothetical protein